MRWLLPGFLFLSFLGCGASDNPPAAKSQVAEVNATKETKSQAPEAKAPQEVLELALRVCEIDRKRCSSPSWGIEEYVEFKVMGAERVGASRADELNGINDRWKVATFIVGRKKDGSAQDFVGCLWAIQKSGRWLIEEYLWVPDRVVGARTEQLCV